MTRLSIAWLLLAAMCLMLVFRIDLHSDLLFLDSVAVDLFGHGGAWKNWTITPAAAYFPDMLAYALAYFVLPLPTERIVFVCLIQAILLVSACMYLARVIKPSFSTNAKMFVLIVTTAVVLVAANSLMWLFFNSTNNHFAALLFPLLCLAWSIGFLKEKKLSALLFITAGVAAGTASTSIFTIAFTAPALVYLAGCVVVFRAHRQFRTPALQIGATILIGHAIAALLQKVLLTYNELAGRPLFTLDTTLHAITEFAAATRASFGPENKYTFVLAMFLAICFVWVVLDWILSMRLVVNKAPGCAAITELEVLGKNWAYGLSVTFLLVVFPVNVISAVFSGGFGDYAGYRYFTFPITLGTLLWILMLDFKGAFNTRLAGLLGALSMLALVVLAIFSMKPLLVQSGRTSYAALATKGIHGGVDFVAQCIDQEAKKGFVFGSGIGDFWNARGLSYKTAQPLVMLATTVDALPFFHMMSLGPLINPQQYRIKPYNFAVLGKSGTVSQFNQTAETFGQHLPKPARTVSCANSDSELWLYTDLSLDTVVQRNVNQFLGQLGLVGNYHMAGSNLAGTVGKVQSQSRVAEAGVDANGFLSYGPYLTLPAGRYRAAISYSATAPGNRWDAGRFNTPGNVLIVGQGDVPQGNGEVTFSFETHDKMVDFEIRAWFGGHGTFAIHKIQLQPVGSR